MKNKLTPKQNVWFGLVLMCLLLIGSCKKDLLQEEGQQNFQPLNKTNASNALPELKQWYQQQEHIVLNSKNWLNTLFPNWDKVQVQQNEKESIYEITLHNPNEVFAVVGGLAPKDEKKVQLKKSNLRLLIFRDKATKDYRACFRR